MDLRVNIKCYKADLIRFEGGWALPQVYSQNVCDTCPQEQGKVHFP